MRAEYLDILSVPSISSSEEYRDEMRRCADLLHALLQEIGLERVQCLETKGYPVVYGEWLHQPGQPVILLYGHYDVQPPGDPGAWESPPFTPTIRNERLYGRGAVDNKGQLFIQLEAVRTLLEQRGSLPFNVKVLIEGEEEIGSPSLPGFLERHQALLACDAVVISDTAMLGSGLPSVCHALRGLLHIELEVVGPAQDLHSGSFYGGAVVNPLQVAAELITGMKDKQGRIRIDGFYDHVRMSAEDRRLIQEIPFDEAAIAERIGVPSFGGEADYSHLEKVWLRPTLEVNGMEGGSANTIIPHKARTFLSCRLAPGQDPYDIQQKIERHLEVHQPAGVRIQSSFSGHAYPYLLAADHPLVTAALASLEEVYQRKAYPIRAGGTIPVVEWLSRIYDVPVVMLGFGLPDSGVHGPNEQMPLAQFAKGVETLVNYYLRIGREGKQWLSGTNWHKG
ncbi:dipeptidase [Brevibacillus humidisoli]|uniref:dipeptidase n=1 Tax=Brevibacillus humidisoli TaxID=2895522 RepID=UPI001E3EC2C4|nr:dipeptidase [Brevibacillus humidisoli]UFJ40753.1 dipeptidase [Brevibacillus humidisoli]